MKALSRPEERRLHGLHRRSAREETGLFLAEGVRVVEELAQSTLDIELAVAGAGLDRTPRGQALLEALARRTEIRTATAAEMGRIAATDSPQDIVAAAKIPAVRLEDVKFGEASIALALDAVQDPGNFGTLVRCAEAFGVDIVIAMTGTVDPWNPKAVRAAAGASFRTPIAMSGTGEALDWMRDAGYAIWVADAAGEPAADVTNPRKVALVAGNEGAGVSEAVIERAARRVAVPIRGRAESLNVAIATGILLYLLTTGTQ